MENVKSPKDTLQVRKYVLTHGTKSERENAFCKENSVVIYHNQKEKH